MRLQSWTFNAHVFTLLLSLINGLIHCSCTKLIRFIYLFWVWDDCIFIIFPNIYFIPERISITQFYFESLRFMWFICTWKVSFRKFLYLYWHLKCIQMRYNFYECQRIKEFHRCHLPLWSDISANAYWYHFKLPLHSLLYGRTLKKASSKSWKKVDGRNEHLFLLLQLFLSRMIILKW